MTVEAFLSRKPVVTTADAGGAAGVRDRRARRASSRSPTPGAIAARHRHACGRWPEARLREMGEAGYARVADITWDHVIDRLTESIR